MTYTLHLGDCLGIMPSLAADSVDSIVTDPPYGLSFMGKGWDHGVPGVEFWREALRVAKPGAHLLAFGGDRTHHRLMSAIEDAGWEIRTCIYWAFGSGFPKSRNIGKAMLSEFSEDALCACVRHSTGITQDSQVDYRLYRHSGDEQLHMDQGNVPSVSQSQDDALSRIHDDLRSGDLAEVQANTYPDEASGLPSIVGCSPQSERRLEDCQLSDSTHCGTQESMLRERLTVTHKTDYHISDKSSSVFGSVSSSSDSPLTHSDMPYCTTCGKPIASYWEGWGTALKPSVEIIVLCRKPLIGTVAANVLQYGTGGINVDQCRIMPEVQQRDAYAYMRLSSLYSDAYKQVLSQEISLDALRYIVSALRSYSIVRTDHLHNACDQGGTLSIPAEYVTLVTALFPNGVWCALTGYKVQDSLADCQSYHHLHDEYIHALTVAAQESPSSLADALSHICREQLEHTHNHDHQYTVHPSNSDAYLPTFCVSFLMNVLKHYTTYLSPRQSIGRWPSNLIHDGSADVVGLFPVTSSHGGGQSSFGGIFGNGKPAAKTVPDTGSAARFFYSAKASKADRDEGLDLIRNTHPTVKPTSLMRYLCKLVTQPGGVVLDPFMGSGSTGKAAMLEGFSFIGIEQEAESFEIARARVAHAASQCGPLFAVSEVEQAVTA